MTRPTRQQIEDVMATTAQLGREPDEIPSAEEAREALSGARRASSRRDRRKDRREEPEALEQRRLARMASQAPWGRGYRRWRTESPLDRHRTRAAAEGYVRGWPDCCLLLPDRPPAAVELKRPDLAPKRDAPAEWWLSWSLSPLQRRLWATTPDYDPTHYGLAWSQARELQYLASCGWATLVAYSAGEAFDWLDRHARGGV